MGEPAGAGVAALWRTRSPRAALLYPASLIFRMLVAVRRAAYQTGLRPALRLPVPVVVVGNITVGGAGKTPLVLRLARDLAARGRRPGIVSRGYGGSAADARRVGRDDDVAVVGDEPLLLARRAGCPVWIGRDRVAAARALLAADAACDIVLCDDGLQHYRLARDLEIAVIDERGLGNGWLLPAGPLREPAHRLRDVDALVANGKFPLPPAADRGRARVFRMGLAGDRFVSLGEPGRSCGPADLAGARLHAVAGIGHPQRFFDHLGRLGLDAQPHPFPDHHRFRREDFSFVAPGERLLMTEKDAVKCAALAPANTWVLPVEAELVPDLADYILEKLDGRPPA